MNELGIKAVVITRESLQKDPDIWKKVEKGEYRVIYATPEVLLRARSYFMKTIVRGDNAFNKNLALIALDEAHTVCSYRRFRSQFKQIGKLRDCYPEIPFVALSATLPPHVVEYVRKVCKMHKDVDMITVNGRRSNIDLLVTEQYGLQQLDQLVDKLIPSEDFRMDDIPQTLVFVDAVELARKIAITLRVKVYQSNKDHNVFRGIRAYYSSIDQEAKSKTEALVASQEARIVVCTDAMSLGVDFAKIERVIQWGVNDKLTMDNLVQRIGRAARDQTYQGVAIVYCPFQLLKSIKEELKEASNSDIAPTEEGTSTPAGTAKKRANSELDRLLSLPVLHETATEVSKLKEQLYEEAKKGFAATVDESRRQVGASGRQHYRRTGVDTGVLWFLGTTGCRHRCLLSYMDFPDVFDDASQRSWCCDNCAIRRGGSIDDLSAIGTAGFSPACSISLHTKS